MSEPIAVLVIEDDSQLLRTLRDILRHRGYHPITAGSGREGIDLASQNRPSPAIALVDLKLPDMDGMEVIGRLREVSTLIEAIVLTGNASVDSAVRALRQHTCDYLVKPVAPAQLFMTLERASERWQRRVAEQALKQSEERSQRLLENISDIVAVVDADLVFRYVSPSVTRVTGYGPEHLVGRSCLEVAHPEDAILLRRAIEDSAERPTGGPPQRVRMRHADGHWRVLEMTSARLVGHGDLDGLVLTARDVTEWQRLEAELRQAQKMESIGHLAGGVAHDFNNLLTAILGFSEMLIDDSDPRGSSRQDLLAIQQAAEHGASLTRQLLAFSRRQVLEPTVLDLGALVENLESILRRLIGEGVDTLVIRQAALGSVKADAGQIEQVLMNLAVNARDAMPDGGKLTIETRNVVLDDDHMDRHTYAANGHYVLLAVSDTGTGMDATTQAQRLRTVLHHQAAGARHRPGALDRLRHRQAKRWVHRYLQRGRPGHDLQDLLSLDW